MIFKKIAKVGDPYEVSIFYRWVPVSYGLLNTFGKIVDGKET